MIQSVTSTDLHLTYHQRAVPGDVIAYCCWWKYEVSAKPEVGLIFTITAVENRFFLSIPKMVKDTKLDTDEVR